MSIYTNDQFTPKFDVVLKGQIEKFAEIKPRQVKLKGVAGEPTSADVRISPNELAPFTITEVKTQKDGLITASIETSCGSGTAQCIRVENVKATKGRYHDIITVKTDSTHRRSFPIHVTGNIQ